MRPGFLALFGGTIAWMLVTRAANAQTATQVVRFQVNAVSQIGVSGEPVSMAISSAVAGSGPTSVTANGATYAVTTNELNQKITASLDQVLPAGITLEVALVAPAGASSAGSVSLNTVGADVVTGLSRIVGASLPITYRLSATPAAQISGPAARTVTFTIVSGT